MRVTRKRTKRVKGSRKALLERIDKRDDQIQLLKVRAAGAENQAGHYKSRYDQATREITRLREENMKLKEQVFNPQGFKAKFQKGAQIDG